MNKLCLFYIEGIEYDFSGIKVTIKSLREHYKEKIIVLHKNIDERLLQFLIQQDVECIDCTDYNVLFKTSPYNNKVLYLFLFLKRNIEKYKHYDVMLCDIGDVYFTIDPFSICVNQKQPLVLFLEDQPFKDCKCNSTWIAICYNQQILEKINNCIVINAGIYLASYLHLFEFFSLMVKEMSYIFSRINYPIVEQAIVNKLIYIDKINCILDSQNVNNMAQGIKTEANNKINHQYKVNPKIKLGLYKHYDC
jgi:hypothetical protein